MTAAPQWAGQTAMKLLENTATPSTQESFQFSSVLTREPTITLPRRIAMDEGNIAWHIWLGVIISIVPATILVPIRFYARTHGSEPAGLKADDWLILAALVSS